MATVLAYKCSAIKFQVADGCGEYARTGGGYIIDDARISVYLVKCSGNIKYCIAISCAGHTVIVYDFKVSAVYDIAGNINSYISVTVKNSIERTSCIGYRIHIQHKTARVIS